MRTGAPANDENTSGSHQQRVCGGADAQPPKGGTDRCAHTSLPGEPYRAHAELRPRQQEEAGRGEKKTDTWITPQASGKNKSPLASLGV